MWRDGSAVYGSNAEKLQKVRTFKDGKLKISSDGLLLHDKDGVAVSGDVRNSWIGVSTLQALFIKEHNAVCDALKVVLLSQKEKCQLLDFSLSCEWVSFSTYQLNSELLSFFMMFLERISSLGWWRVVSSCKASDICSYC